MNKNNAAHKVRKNHRSPKSLKKEMVLKVKDILFLEKGLIGKILEQLEGEEKLPAKDKILKQFEQP